MSAAKHTPGPWRDDGRQSVYAGGLLVGCAARLNDATEVSANSRLIAAAPELLAACREAIVALCASLGEDPTRESVVDILRGAVAKSTVAK